MNENKYNYRFNDYIFSTCKFIVKTNTEKQNGWRWGAEEEQGGAEEGTEGEAGEGEGVEGAEEGGGEGEGGGEEEGEHTDAGHHTGRQPAGDQEADAAAIEAERAEARWWAEEGELIQLVYR